MSSFKSALTQLSCWKVVDISVCYTDMSHSNTFQIDILSDRMYELINKRHLLRCSLCNCLSEASVQLKADKSCVGL